MSPIERDRPHAWKDVGLLADRPLEDVGLANVRTFAAETTGAVEHSARVVTHVPTLADGREAAEHGPVLPFAPKRGAELDSSAAPPVAFEWDGTVLRAQVALPDGVSSYGLGEHAGPLERTGREHVLWNTDAWRYGDEHPALYQSHPFVLALLPDGSAVGLLADTPARGRIATLADGVELAFEGEPFALHRIDAADPRDVLRALAAMIGPAPLPPLWALGYHQCRWSYASADEVRAIARGFRERNLPCDAVWLDIDHMDRFRVFTFDDERFPDPAGLVRELANEGLRTVAIVDPGVAVDHPIADAGRAGAHFVIDAEGTPCVGRVWPGRCHFPDFTRAETRAWWAEHVREFLERTGIAGLWNDMNEPSVFRAPACTLPDAALHRGLGGGTHARFHNLYGQLMAEATLEGMRTARPDARPFVLTRANHLAGSRLAATWTGDNQARWEDLAWAVPMVLNLGLSGQPFSGPDLGGFHGDPEPELFARWFELGAFLPFCRGHSDKASCRKEPWSFGAETLAHVRSALEVRMRLLPTLYTLFEEASRTGLPVARPLWFADPSDARLREVDDAFLLGDDLLVAPVVRAGATERRVLLPRNPGGWYAFKALAEPGAPAVHFAGDEAVVHAPLGATPVFARAGAVVVLGPARMHTGDRDEERAWHVFEDADGRARGRVYEDAGDGFAHLAGEFRETRIEARTVAGEVLFDVEERGHFAPRKRRRVVHAHAP